MKKLLVLLLLPMAGCANLAGALGAAFQGQQDYEAGRPIAAAPAPPIEQPKRIDYNCVNICRQRYPTIQIQTCWGWCTY